MFSLFIDPYIITNPALNSRVGDVEVQNSTSTFQMFAQNLIDVTLGLAGVYFFIQVLRGGYEYITAAGDKEAVQKAQKRLTNAAIGLVIVFSIFVFIYIAEVLFGISILRFNIPKP